MNLFDKYGGVPVITGIVRDFYKRMLRRPQLRRYFEGVDMERLVLHQVQFIAYVMGKPADSYRGRDLRMAHQAVGITQASFDLTLELLHDALRHGGVSQEDADQIIESAKATRELIVSR